MSENIRSASFAKVLRTGNIFLVDATYWQNTFEKLESNKSNVFNNVSLVKVEATVSITMGSLKKSVKLFRTSQNSLMSSTCKLHCYNY